jgi:hypothetical protein
VAFGIAIGYAAASQAPARSEPPAERATGIGGVFFKAKDPRALAVWYRDSLGLVPDPAAGNNVIFKWRDRDDRAQVGNTVWALFPRDTKYFGPGGSTFMLNYRVRWLPIPRATGSSCGNPRPGTDRTRPSRFGLRAASTRVLAWVWQCRLQPVRGKGRSHLR